MKINLYKIFLLTFFSFNFCYSKDFQNKIYDLAVCAVFQNEDFYLKEWIEFHKVVGVQHFYLYNNLSTDNYKEILKPYIESGEVDLFEWPIKTDSEKDYLNNLQLPVYNHALAIAKHTSHWIAFIDLDEFLFPVKHPNLIELLKEYKSYAGLAVNWQIYGTSWLDNLPTNGLIIENLIYKAPTEHKTNMTVKMVVQPKFVKSINNPHFFDFIEGYFAVDSSKNQLPSGIYSQHVLIDTIRINHYWSGTNNWLLNQKLERRKKWGLNFPESLLKIIMETFNQVQDKAIFRFLPMLKKSCAKSNKSR